MELIYMFCIIFAIVMPIKILNIIYIKKEKSKNCSREEVKLNLMSETVSYDEYLKVSEEIRKGVY